jgi:hypothetical protein
LSHVDTFSAHRSVVFSQQAQGFPVVTARRSAIGMDDAVPRHTAAPMRHHPADLARPALSEKLGDIPVCHHLAARDRVDDVEHPLGERRHLGGGHVGSFARCASSGQFACWIVIDALYAPSAMSLAAPDDPRVACARFRWLSQPYSA